MDMVRSKGVGEGVRILGVVNTFKALGRVAGESELLLLLGGVIGVWAPFPENGHGVLAHLRATRTSPHTAKTPEQAVSAKLLLLSILTVILVLNLDLP